MKVTPKRATPQAAPLPTSPTRRSEELAAPQVSHPARGAPTFDRTHLTPQTLLAELKAKRVDPRTFSREQRQACVALLMNGKLTTHELASLFGVSSNTMGEDVRLIRREYGRLVKTWTPEDVVGKLAMAADKFTTLALKQEDVGLAWTIQRDLVELLLKLGVGKDAHGTGEVTGLKVTIETVSQGHGKARGLLARAMNPLLSGEEVVVDATSVPATEGDEELAAPQTPDDDEEPAPPMLPVRSKRVSEPKADPGRVEVHGPDE